MKTMLLNEAGTTLEYEHESDGPFDDVNWKPERFVIDNDRKADWAIRKIKTERAERDRLVALADEQIRELMEKKRELTERCETRTAHLGMLLRLYFDTVETTATKTQETYKLLSGRLVLKRQQPEFVRDEAVLVDWAKTNTPDLVQVKESVAWGELKKMVAVDGDKVVIAETGEVVPGVTAQPREDVFEVVV